MYTFIQWTVPGGQGRRRFEQVRFADRFEQDTLQWMLRSGQPVMIDRFATDIDLGEFGEALPEHSPGVSEPLNWPLDRIVPPLSLKAALLWELKHGHHPGKQSWEEFQQAHRIDRQAATIRVMSGLLVLAAVGTALLKLIFR